MLGVGAVRVRPGRAGSPYTLPAIPKRRKLKLFMKGIRFGYENPLWRLSLLFFSSHSTESLAGFKLDSAELKAQR
jgi:hypothetical protein